MCPIVHSVQFSNCSIVQFVRNWHAFVRHQQHGPWGNEAEAWSYRRPKLQAVVLDFWWGIAPQPLCQSAIPQGHLQLQEMSRFIWSNGAFTSSAKLKILNNGPLSSRVKRTVAEGLQDELQKFYMWGSIPTVVADTTSCAAATNVRNSGSAGIMCLTAFFALWWTMGSVSRRNPREKPNAAKNKG